MLRTRDKDHDGFLVWGGNSMLENVRDELDVIWQLFGDKTDSPSRVKALDLMCMMVKEERSLAAMASQLGLADEARDWNSKADAMSDLIRTRMWDEQSGYFYNLSRDTGTMMTADGISLKRPEIITFLPLWAGVATKQQAARLVANLTDPKTFWRRFGVPTLAATRQLLRPLYHQMLPVERCRVAPVGLPGHAWPARLRLPCSRPKRWSAETWMPSPTS